MHRKPRVEQYMKKIVPLARPKCRNPPVIYTMVEYSQTRRLESGMCVLRFAGRCSCVQNISVTSCEENIMFWEVSGIGTKVIGLLWNLPFLGYSFSGYFFL